MYMVKGDTSCDDRPPRDRQDHAPAAEGPPRRDESRGRGGACRGGDGPIDGLRSGPPEKPEALVYVDPRAFTRDCFSRWLQNSLSGFRVCVLADPEQIVALPLAREHFRAVIVNTGPERMSSSSVTRLLSWVTELLPGVPVVVLSNYEDAENIRQAFALDVQGYIPTSLASLVAAEAVRLVCAGGTFAPAAVLLSSWRSNTGDDGTPLFEGFTQRQAQILDCLRRGLPNKLIAYELNMCESTVKVHIRNIMKKLSATNRTQVVYLTRDLFEGTGQYKRAS